MRINVYSQELTREVKIVMKVSEDGRTHFGVRIYFASSPLLHDRPDDDDGSAITYWISRGEEFGPADLGRVFAAAATHCFYLAGTDCADEEIDLSQDVQAPPSQRGGDNE